MQLQKELILVKNSELKMKCKKCDTKLKVSQNYKTKENESFYCPICGDSISFEQLKEYWKFYKEYNDKEENTRD